MNAVMTVTKNGHVAAATKRTELMREVGWMGYLVASFPASKAAPATYRVLEDQFQDEASDVLFEAARLYVREGGKWLPSAFEFRPFVERVRSTVEDAQIAAAWQATVNSWPHLRARRTALLEQWYAGEASDSDVLALADELQTAGLVSAAASLRAKVRPSPERPDYAELVVRYAEHLQDAAAKGVE